MGGAFCVAMSIKTQFDFGDSAAREDGFKILHGGACIIAEG
jgi:hypothetical protein